MGKGLKERMVAFGSSVRNALLNYPVHFRGEPAHTGVEEFFLTIDGYAMIHEGVKTLLRRIGVAAGVPRLHVTCAFTLTQPISWSTVAMCYF